MNQLACIGLAFVNLKFSKYHITICLIFSLCRFSIEIFEDSSRLIYNKHYLKNKVLDYNSAFVSNYKKSKECIIIKVYNYTINKNRFHNVHKYIRIPL